MKKKSLLGSSGIILLALAATAFAQAADLQAILDTLVKAEQAFARTAAEKGTRAAFLTCLAEDAVVFQPGPVRGREVWEKAPATSPTTLLWRPVHAEVARSGHLGWTTGPWEMKQRDSGAVTGHGTFLSVWKKQADGSWKVAVDLGVRHGAPSGSAPTVAGPAVPIKAVEIATGFAGNATSAIRASLLQADRALFNAARERGTVAAYAERLAEDARLLRDGALTVLGKEAVRTALAGHAGSLSGKPIAWEVAWSGDLGYVYGSYQLEKSSAGDEAGHYLRIWRRQGGSWKIVADVANPLPPPAPTPPTPPTAPKPPKPPGGG
jgi:ketosteroid isomerase-like protein